MHPPAPAAVSISVSVHALSAGYLTLPSRFFVTPLSDPSITTTVPSLCFLIQHTSPSAVTRLIFDLGLRRDLALYPSAIKKHALTRQPLSTTPDVVASLAVGGLAPEDVDCVVLSHVHWDHIGMPSDFPTARFVVGFGAAALLSGETKLVVGSHSQFERGLLPVDRAVELPDPNLVGLDGGERESGVLGMDFGRWRPRFGFDATMDVFDDGSVYILSAPGHLPGHLNLLCRISCSPVKYVLLAGDACHDRRLLTGEKEIAEWADPNFPGLVCCIHADKVVAKETLRRLRALELGEIEELRCVEVIFAHDAVWDETGRREGRFWPGCL